MNNLAPFFDQINCSTGQLINFNLLNKTDDTNHLSLSFQSKFQGAVQNSGIS